MNSTLELTVYSTSACHLCELALEIIRPLVNGQYSIHEVDISDSDHLIERYGVRIPVVRRSDTGAELGWPFDASQFKAFVAS